MLMPSFLPRPSEESGEPCGLSWTASPGSHMAVPTHKCLIWNTRIANWGRVLGNRKEVLILSAVALYQMLLLVVPTRAHRLKQQGQKPEEVNTRN